MAVFKINKGEILKEVQATQVKPDVPEFSSGDTIVVSNRVIEGKKSRIQKFEGIVLRRRKNGGADTVIVRKESNGVWVEFGFDVNSPLVEKVEVKRYGRTRRAYISYMRQRSGKSARIKEMIKK